jgi:hypothetical protein
MCLIPFIAQIYKLSRKYKNFVFFVDTGVLERTAIKVLNFLGRRTIVVQDALKRIPKSKNTKSLTWFGGANASCYLLTGSRYASMVTNNKYKIVGSPIYENTIKNVSLGTKILVINQCFARYGEMSTIDELSFMEKVVKKVVSFGPVELRLHPHNDIFAYKHLEQYGIEISKNKSLSSSIKEAGVVIGVNSTALLEAMTMMRPVIIMDWHPSPFENPIKLGIIRCRNISDMCSVLENWKKVGRLTSSSEYKIKKEILSHIAYSGQESVDRIIGTLSKYDAM